jgi:putative transposase
MIEVPARNTTIDCSRCGNMVLKTLAIRIHKCNVCGLELDRDHNAALNILKKGIEILEKLPQELREVTSVEISKRSRKQKETTGFVSRCSQVACFDPS